MQWWRVLPKLLLLSINLHHIGVIVHMNIKMILAALALSLSLAACAKQEAPAEVAQEAPPVAEAPADEAAPADEGAMDAVPAEGAPDVATDAATDPAMETPPAQ